MGMIQQVKRITISVVMGVMITAFAHFLYAQGGEYLAVPGMFISGWIDLFAYEMSGADDFPRVLSWQFCGIGFYSMVVYALLITRSALSAEKQSSVESIAEI